MFDPYVAKAIKLFPFTCVHSFPENRNRPSARLQVVLGPEKNIQTGAVTLKVRLWPQQKTDFQATHIIYHLSKRSVKWTIWSTLGLRYQNQTQSAEVRSIRMAWRRWFLTGWTNWFHNESLECHEPCQFLLSSVKSLDFSNVRWAPLVRLPQFSDSDCLVPTT